ncbi:MAG TPA: cystathionine beta-lyase [Sphingomonadaceae bacterium]|jgi:cystathionine beta-lyase|nr:cystathionine beta-lyase [Sphingomonadaceae bacterium]
MHWRSKLIHSDAAAPPGFRGLASATHRASTVVFPSLAAALHDPQGSGGGYTYGLHGTPTVLELAARIAELEGAHATVIVPSGLNAISLVYLALCRAGSHVLVPENAYAPNRELGAGLLAGFGIVVEAYDPLIGGGIDALIRPQTSLIWTESPGSVTMEVQDIPAICAAAKAHGVPVAIDNTYGAGVLFDAFAHGVDVSMQALTKYVGGHSDVLLGSVSCAAPKHARAIDRARRALGIGVSPDECSLALRGLQTLAVRLDHLERSTMEIAAWLAARPEVERMLHPAFADCPGHDLWKRDFTGSASLFSVVFRASVTDAAVARFVDALRLFKIGFSWGGVTSLVMGYPPIQRTGCDYGRRLVRLNIGLEDSADLIADLDAALAEMAAE